MPQQAPSAVSARDRLSPSPAGPAISDQYRSRPRSPSVLALVAVNPRSASAVRSRAAGHDWCSDRWCRPTTGLSEMHQDGSHVAGSTYVQHIEPKPTIRRSSSTADHWNSIPDTVA